MTATPREPQRRQEYTEEQQSVLAILRDDRDEHSSRDVDEALHKIGDFEQVVVPSLRAALSVRPIIGQRACTSAVGQTHKARCTDRGVDRLVRIPFVWTCEDVTRPVRSH
jgi:hypothetical protein